MHALAHARVKDRLGQRDQTTAWVAMAAVLARSTERYGFYQPFWRLLKPHIEVCADFRRKECFVIIHFEIARTFCSLGWFLFTMHSTSRTQKLLTATLSKLLYHHASVSESILKTQDLLGRCYYDLEQYLGTAELFEAMVEIRSAMDSNHPARIASEHELAKADFKTGQHEEAIRLLEKVIKIERATNPKHHNCLVSEHGLAVAYFQSGQQKEAIKLLRKVVQIRSSTLNPEHPDRLASEHMLGLLYFHNEQHEQAIKLLENVVQTRSSILDPKHPDRLISEYVLGRTYLKMSNTNRRSSPWKGCSRYKPQQWIRRILIV